MEEAPQADVQPDDDFGLLARLKNKYKSKKNEILEEKIDTPQAPAAFEISLEDIEN